MRGYNHLNIVEVHVDHRHLANRHDDFGLIMSDARTVHECQLSIFQFSLK